MAIPTAAPAGKSPEHTSWALKIPHLFRGAARTAARSILTTQEGGGESANSAYALPLFGLV